MADPDAIGDDAALDAALIEVRRLWGTEPWTSEGKRLDVLMSLVCDYEDAHHILPLPNPIAAVRIRMADLDINEAALGECLGVSMEHVSDILGGRCPLTSGMVRILSEKLSLSEACLAGAMGNP